MSANIDAVLARLDEMNNGEINYEVYRELHDLVSAIEDDVQAPIELFPGTLEALDALSIRARTTSPDAATAEQILWELYPDDLMDHNRRANCHRFLEQLRAHGLLSEGVPSEEHPEFCYCGQILKREDKIDFYTLKCPKLQCGGFRMVPKRSAGVASQEVIDEDALAEVEKAFRIVQGVLRGLDSGEIVSEPAISALAAEVSTDLNTLTDYLREHHIRITYREDAS